MIHFKSIERHISSNVGIQAIIIFLVAFITNIIILPKGEGIAIYPDHFGLLAAPAKIVGFNWSDAVTLAGYYGPGYFILYTPLLYLKKPLVVYNMIVDIHMAVLSIAAVVVYGFLLNTLKPKRKILLAISVIIGTDFVLQTLVVKAFGNEAMIVLISSLFSILVYKYCNSESTRLKVFLFLLGSLLMIYAITVHVRNILFIPAIGLFSIYRFLRKRLIDKKKIVLFGILYFLFCIISISVYRIFPLIARNVLFQTNTAEIMHNQEVNFQITSNWKEIITTFLYMVYGSFIASIKQTYGIIVITIYLTVKSIKHFVLRKDYVVNESFEMIFIFSAICYWIAWFATCLKWRGIPRGTGYWRYYGSYCIIMLVLSIYYFFAYADFRRKTALFLTTFVLCFIKIFQVVIIPTLGDYLEFWYTYPKFQDSNDKYFDYYKTAIVMLLGVFILLYIKKRKVQIYTVYFIIFYTIACYQGGDLMTYVAHDRCDKGYILAQELSERRIIKDDEDIFFIGSDSGYLYYQYMFFDRTIRRLVYNDGFKDYYGNELVNIENNLIFSNVKRSDFGFVNELWFDEKLDENEYVYSMNQELIDKVTIYATDLGIIDKSQ